MPSRNWLLAIGSVVCFAPGCDRQVAPPAQAPVAAPAPVVAKPPPAPPLELDVKVARIEKKKTFTKTLSELGLNDEQIESSIAALKEVFDFRKLRLGDQVRVTTAGGRLESLEYRRSAIDEWEVARDGEQLVARKRPVDIVQRVATVDITVQSSLYEAMAAAGEDPSLAVEVADVFAWDVDFFRDVRKGDRVRVVVEKFTAHGRLLRYGTILGARYDGPAVGSKRLLRYQPEQGTVSYFDEKGNSAKKSFLKSPLKYVQITSRYGGRQHPISGYYQAHQGVDYAAAIGTPVWAVSDGVVTKAVHGDRAAGNYLFIRHINGFETGYLHLSRFAEGIHVGARVGQKQVVAFSGNTGMSTGPHLHFAMKRGGSYVNPLNQTFPRADPLPRTELPAFEEQTAEVRAMLDAETIAQL